MTTNETITVTTDELLEKTALMAKEGYRVVQICALTPFKTDPENPAKKIPLPEFEIYYSFDKGYALTNLKLTVPRDQEIPSISRNFFAAFLYENEINEQFGTKITNIALDFKGTLYKKAKKVPFDVYSRQGGGQ